MSTTIRDLEQGQFDAVLERSTQVPVVVDFWAAWCGPCRILGPILERLATEAAGEWELVKVDADRHPDLVRRFRVQGIPTVIGFRDREPVARFTGAIGEGQLRQWLSQVVPTRADRFALAGEMAARDGLVAVAEENFAAALELDPAHVRAGTGLAAILLSRGDPAAALEVLDRLPETASVARLKARARLSADGSDSGTLRRLLGADPRNAGLRLELGRALAAEGAYEEALATLQELVEEGGEAMEEARRSMLDLFVVIDDPDLVARYRRRLANALF